MSSRAREQLVVALDLPSWEAAETLVARLGAQVRWYKVGLELYTAVGPRAVRSLKEAGKRVFLDLKLYDIPNTVARAAVRGAQLGADLIDLHICAGEEALRAAAEAVAQLPAPRPRLLGVTVLTSARSLGGGGAVLEGPALTEAVVARAESAHAAGLDGVVAPAAALRALRARLPAEFRILTPGIRPAGSARGDQRWVATPGEALAAGADWLVVGRPVTRAEDPVSAAAAILAEMEGAGGGSV